VLLQDILKLCKKKLEELGGRPSTYAPTISTIINRNYVEKGKDGQERNYTQLILQSGKVGGEVDK
jgi:DNA topoisomerase-1